MRPTLMRATVLVPLLVIGLLSFILVRNQQNAGGSLAAAQSAAQNSRQTPAALAKVVKAAPDPIGNEKASSASCTPLGQGELHNPWRCVLRYPTGRTIQYQVTLNLNGSYSGDHELLIKPPPRKPASGTINGCCVAVP